MTDRSRDRLQFVYESQITKNDLQTESEIIPDGEIWQIKRITFADLAQPQNNWAGSFKVVFGDDTLAIAYLLGNTLSIDINRTFTGDGVLDLITTRENLGNTDKRMSVMIEGFKRIGV